MNNYGRYSKFNKNKDISSFQFPAANPLVKKTYSLSFQASFQRNWSSNNEYILKNGICSHYSLGVQIINSTKFGIFFRLKWPIFGLKISSRNFEIVDFEWFDPDFWKFTNRSYSRVYRYIRQCIYICFRYLDGSRSLSLNL